jgi:hypothetical protein
MVDARAVAIVGAILWGGVCLGVALAHLAYPSYGVAFLQVVDSIYVGATTEASVTGVVTLALQAVVDGAIVGYAAGWLYNRLSG